MERIEREEMNRAGILSWRLSRFGLYMLLPGWLTVLTIMLLMPPGYGTAEGLGRSHLFFLLRFLSASVVWAAAHGSEWHAFCFMLLAFIAAAIPTERNVYNVLTIVAVLNLYSLATEIIQEVCIPGRAFEWSDLAFNAAGIFTGLFIVLALDRYRFAREQKRERVEKF